MKCLFAARRSSIVARFTAPSAPSIRSTAESRCVRIRRRGNGRPREGFVAEVQFGGGEVVAAELFRYCPPHRARRFEGLQVERRPIAADVIVLARVAYGAENAVPIGRAVIRKRKFHQLLPVLRPRAACPAGWLETSPGNPGTAGTRTAGGLGPADRRPSSTSSARSGSQASGRNPSLPARRSSPAEATGRRKRRSARRNARAVEPCRRKGRRSRGRA